MFQQKTRSIKEDPSNTQVNDDLDSPSAIEPSAKRRKVSPEKDDKLKPPVTIRPAPLPLHAFYGGGPPPQTPEGPLISTNRLRPKSVPSNRRASALNLRNYPTCPHPAGIAIWILQKVDQMRKDPLDSPGPSYSHSMHWQTPSDHFQPPPNPQILDSSYAWASPSIAPWPQPADSGSVAQEEPDAVRLQSQRDRKTKQRSENWAKNKENDVVARAKLEAKKKFTAETSEAERQEWIEQRIKEDFERLLNRLAAQLHGEIAHLGPFQLGFADYFYDASKWPPGTDTQVLHAGRLLCAVLPGLTENQVTERSQTAAISLVTALEESKQPHPNAFFAAIRNLSENTEVISGIEILLSHLFAPKMGPSLARKRTGDQSRGSASSTNSLSAPPQQGPPVWHWKEPATVQNPTRPTPPPPPNPYSTCAQRYPESPNPGDRQAQPFSAAPPYTSYPPYSQYSAYSWAPYQYPPPMGPLPPHPPLSLPLQYPQSYHPVPTYSQYAPQQPSPYYPPAAKPLPYDQPVIDSSFSDSRPSAHSGQQSAGRSANNIATLSGEARNTNNKSEPATLANSAASNSTAPGTPSARKKSSPQIHDDIEALRPRDLDGADDLRTSSPAAGIRSSGNRKLSSLAPATPEAENVSNCSDIVSPTQAIDADSIADEDTIEVYDPARSTAASPSSTTSVEEPAPRFSTRERKPTARAISANMMLSLFSRGLANQHSSAMAVVSCAKASPPAVSVESTAQNPREQGAQASFVCSTFDVDHGIKQGQDPQIIVPDSPKKQLHKDRRNVHLVVRAALPEEEIKEILDLKATPRNRPPRATSESINQSIDKADTLPIEPTIEAEEPAQLRASGRERKPTAKALALSNSTTPRKRSASTAGSPPPSRFAKTTDAARNKPSALRRSSISPDELAVPGSSQAMSSCSDITSIARHSPGTRASRAAEVVPVQGSKAKNAVLVEAGESGPRHGLEHNNISSKGQERPPTRITLFVKEVGPKYTSTEDAGPNARITAPAENLRGNKSTRHRPSKAIPPSKSMIPKTASERDYDKVRETDSVLLAFAAIVAEWPDSDADGDVSLEMEQKYQERLRTELAKFPNLELSHKPAAHMKTDSARLAAVRRPLAASDYSSIQSQSPESRQIFIPQVNTILRANDSRKASEALAQLSNDDPELRNHEIVELTSPSDSGERSKSTQSSAANWTTTPAGRPLTHKSMGSTRSEKAAKSQFALVKARAAGRSRGLTIDESMSLQQVHNMITAHDNTLHDSIANSRRTSRSHHIGALTNSERDDSPVAIGSNSNGFNKLAPAMQSEDDTVMSHLHNPSNAFNATNSDHEELRIVKMDTIDTPPANAHTRTRSSSKPASGGSSRFKIDTRGINGERPGGGTIINAKETQEAQKERRKSKAASEKNGSSSGRVSPAVHVASFPRGGKLMKFSQFRQDNDV